MAGTFEEELLAEVEALRRFRAEREARRAEEARRPNRHDVDLDTLELPQVQALISMRFEAARLRNRLAEAERRISELERAVGRTG